MDKRLEQFRAALRSGQLTQAFVTAFSHAVELEVTTWVNSKNNPQTTPSAEARSRSKLNLLANKIDTEIGEQFLNHPHAKTLQQFQQQQTAQANAILQKNLHCLEQLHRAFTSFEQFSEETPPSLLSPSPSEPLEPEENIVDALLDSFDDEAEAKWEDEAEEEWEDEAEAEIETRTPEVLTIEDLEFDQEEDWEEEEEDAPPDETASDWQPEAAEVDAMPNFELKEQVNWRSIENQEHKADPGTEADWDELDHELDLNSSSENP